MSNAAPSTSGFTQWFADNRSASGRVLLVIGVAFAGLAAWLIYQSGSWSAGPVALGTDMPLLFSGLILGWSALAFMGCGAWQLSSELPDERKPMAARLVVLMLTGALGAGLFLFGLALLYTWGETLTKLLREGEREGAWRILVALAAMIGGLFIMFAGLQAVRADERKVVGIRRYVYGFNAFLTGFLLLAVLVVVNVLCYLKIPATIDATQTGIFTLSERSKQVLAEIDEPTTIYVVMRPNVEVYEDIRALLSKFQEVAPKLRVETVSLLDDKTIDSLLKKYPRFEGQSQGLLVVMNDDPAKSSFIQARDLVSSEGNPMMGGGETKEKFLGEIKLVNELSFLKSGRQMPAVYVTQGFGEPDLNDQSRRGGFGILKDRLQRRNFDVRPLKLELLNPQIPDDAKIIIVAGPKQTYPQPIADALMNYVDKGGKMIFMLDVVEVGRDQREMPPTGFEGMLAANGIEVTKEQIFRLVTGQGQIGATLEVNAEVDPSSANQPIVMPFKNTEFRFISCRLIRPTKERINPSIRTSTLLITVEGMPVWTEADAQADIQQTLNLFVRDRKEAEKRITDKLPLMLAVSETPRPLPGGPPPAEKPKLVVFGDTTFVSNVRADVRAMGIEFDLFIGSLEWLRERPSNIGIEPKDYQYYEMDRGVVTYRDRLQYLPLLVAGVTVLGLGIGVWLVRRQ